MRRNLRLWMVGALAAGITVWFGAVCAPEAAQMASSREVARLAEKGESIFQEECSACHTIGGGDRATGPDLLGVTERRDREWIRRIIQEPERLEAEKDPQRLALMERYAMRMPDLGISEEETEALLAFLAHPTEEAHAAGEATAPREPAAAPGDAGRGRALFVGEAAFEKGGAPCLACHGFANVGSGGRASYGGDLTAVYEDYGAEGIASVLADLPFPSMEPIYSGRPLTGEEQADLAAFLQTGEGEADEAMGGLVVQVLIGFAVLLLVTFLFGMKRLRSVRRPLLETRSHNTEG